jgi:hypothetical protein
MTAIAIFFSARRGIHLPAGPSTRRVGAASLPEPISRGRFTSKHQPIWRMPVKLGRRGLARIIYPDGCSVNVRSNSLATVAKHSPCSYVGQTGGPPQGNPLDATSGNGWIAGAGLVATGGGIAALLATRPSGSSSQLFAAPLLPASP